jgi:hypothetical protein
MNKLQLYLDLMAAWGDAPIDNEAVIELLEETFNKIYKQGREDEAIESQKDLEDWKNKEAIPTDEQIIMTYFSCSNDEEQGDSADRFRVLFAPAIAQAKQEEKKKALEILDQAEDENWFDMPDTTENWKTWKRIRNTINDH